MKSPNTPRTGGSSGRSSASSLAPLESSLSDLPTGETPPGNFQNFLDRECRRRYLKGQSALYRKRPILRGAALARRPGGKPVACYFGLVSKKVQGPKG